MKSKPWTGPSFWLGVDLAKDTLDAALAPCDVRPADWRRLSVAHFSNTAQGVAELCAWIGQSAPGASCRGVCVESTGAYSRRFAQSLEGRALPEVSIINPARSVEFAKSLGVRNKNDRIDAAILALYGVVYTPKPTPPLSAVQQEIRELDRLRQDLIEQRTAWQNRLAEARGEFARASIKKILQGLEGEIQATEQEAKKAIQEDPTLHRQVQLLETIPGIKTISATTLTVELGDLRDYSRNEILSLAGLFAREHTSGSSVRKKGRMARGGGGRLRRVLYMGATSLQRSRGALGVYVNRLKARGKQDMCALGALMRKLLLVARAVVLSGQPYDPKLAARDKPFQTPQGGSPEMKNAIP